MSQTAHPKTTLSVILGLIVAGVTWWFNSGTAQDTAEGKPGAEAGTQVPAAPPSAGGGTNANDKIKRRDPKPTPTEQASKSEPKDPGTGTPANNNLSRRSTEIVARAFRNKQSDVILEGEAKVKFTLRDDNEGSRHQKWVCEFENTQTVLFSHNIDLAPRVPLSKGDVIQFHGEYEWTKDGGVIHWTHHDPGRRRDDGWIKHNGEIYKD